MELGKIIAMNLKQLRAKRNLTLGQLSKASGISKAMLSDIEKGNSNPTINTIWKIANGLKVPYTRLIDCMDHEATLIHRDEAAMQTSSTHSYRVFNYFTTSSTRNFELFRVELDGQCTHDSIGHSEKSLEYIYVVHGELILHSNIADYTLNEGDSLEFDSSIAHSYINSQDEMVKFIVINYYQQ